MKFIHKRNESNKGGLTVGYVLDEASVRAVVTVARCNYRDNYSRVMGRTICESRYEHGTGWLVPVDPENVVGSILRRVEKVLEGAK